MPSSFIGWNRSIGLTRQHLATASWFLQGTLQSHGVVTNVIGIGQALKKQGDIYMHMSRPDLFINVQCKINK